MHAAPPLPGWLRRRFDVPRFVWEGPLGPLAFVDVGPKDAPPVLLVHGNPTWSFLWRKVIGALDGARLRLIAPDLYGFGASEKPRSTRAHRLDTHVDAIAGLVDALGVAPPIVVGQDWGGPIACGVGERLGAAGVVLGNTSVLVPARPFRSKAFHRFSHLPLVSDAVFRGLLFPVPVLRRVQGDPSTIGLAETAAYAWPLLHPLDRAGPLGLARMVPDAEEHPSTAPMDRIGAWVASFDGPAALLWGRRDPILGRGMRRHREALPQASVRETDAGHFAQEETPDLWAACIREVAELP